MNKPKPKQVAPEDIPEVADYLDAKSKLDDFREEYKNVFEQYDALVEDHNTKLEQAEKIVRAQEVTCGPFDLYQWQTKYDAEKFYDAVGREDFLKLGGHIETVPQYSIDKKMFEAAVAQKKIPQSVINAVVEVSPRYKCPKPVTK